MGDGEPGWLDRPLDQVTHEFVEPIVRSSGSRKSALLAQTLGQPTAKIDLAPSIGHNNDRAAGMDIPVVVHANSRLSRSRAVDDHAEAVSKAVIGAGVR